MSSADQYFIEENVRKSGTSFFWGMKRLPKEQKRAMFALYAFCREVDDIADEKNLKKKNKLNQILVWEKKINSIFKERKFKDSLSKELLEAIKKFDFKTQRTYIWSAYPRGFVGEPLIVPSEKVDQEDEGWVLVLVWNSKRKGTDLVILNASDLTEKATLEVPIVIPYGLHGSWSQG